MRATLRTIWSTGRSEPALVTLAELPLPIRLVRHARARRLTLRVERCGTRLRLTLPPRAGRSAALRWAAGQAEWVRRQVEGQVAPVPLDAGSSFPLDGREVRIAWAATAARGCRLDGDVLQVGGPAESIGARVERWLKAQAKQRLTAATLAKAAEAGVTVSRVSIGDPRGRWGSCSASGAIRYSWRLILAPPEIQRWIVAHEVAHRVHLNHGPAFKALEAELYGGDVAAARALLRRLGPRLQRVGRSR